MNLFKKFICFFIIIVISFGIDFSISILYASTGNSNIFLYKYIGYSEDLVIFLFNIIYGLLIILPPLYIAANDISGFKTFVIIRQSNKKLFIKKYLFISIYIFVLILCCLSITHMFFSRILIFQTVTFIVRHIAIVTFVTSIAYLTVSPEKAIISYLALAIFISFLGYIDIKIVFSISVLGMVLSGLAMFIGVNKYSAFKEKS